MKYIIVPVVISLVLVVMWYLSGSPERHISNVVMASLISVLTSIAIALFEKG